MLLQTLRTCDFDELAKGQPRFVPRNKRTGGSRAFRLPRPDPPAAWGGPPRRAHDRRPRSI